MSVFSMAKLRSILPGGHNSGQQLQASNSKHRHSMTLEPEIGFQLTIEMSQQQNSPAHGSQEVYRNELPQQQQERSTVPELCVHLMAARHLPALFGFKIVQGYLIKVKLFPGSKRLDSTIQTNTWPKFNETFRFPLVPEIKSSMKHAYRRGSKAVSGQTPEELLDGQFVVFTVYALLELPQSSFNRFNKTYRSLRDKSTSLVQKVVESTQGHDKDKGQENSAGDANGKPNGRKSKGKSSNEGNPKDAIPPLTISESRRNLGSVTCYLEPKIFKRQTRSGQYATEEIWLPIKDITRSLPSPTQNNNNLASSAPKGVVEIVLQLKESQANGSPTTERHFINDATATSAGSLANGNDDSLVAPKRPQWNRMTSEVKRKMGISGSSSKSLKSPHNLVLSIGTSRMRCSNKVKDELESTAGSVYIKTTVFEHGIYIDSWKSSNFYPSLSTKWNTNDSATINVPLQSKEDLENLLIRTTLATKTKLGKKLVLGTVVIAAGSPLATPGSAAAATPTSSAGHVASTGAINTGLEHMHLLAEAPLNETVPLWHCFQ